MLQRLLSGGCVLASTLCTYDLMEGRFVCSELGKGATSEAGSLSSVLPVCGGSVRSTLSLPSVARRPDNKCMYMAHVCFMSVVVTVWGSAGNAYCVAAVVKHSVF